MGDANKDSVNVWMKIRTLQNQHRVYLDASVIHIVLKGLQHLLVERPSNPVTYLGEYLIDNDPLKPPPEPEPKEAVCTHCAHSPPPPPPPPVEDKPPVPPPEGEGQGEGGEVPPAEE